MTDYNASDVQDLSSTLAAIAQRTLETDRQYLGPSIPEDTMLVQTEEEKDLTPPFADDSWCFVDDTAQWYIGTPTGTFFEWTPTATGPP